MKRFNINLPDELYERVRREAFDNRISMSLLILGKIDLPPHPMVRKIKTPIKPMDKVPDTKVTPALNDPEKYCPHMVKFKDCTECI